jgi:predicted nucleic acid-binding protein
MTVRRLLGFLFFTRQGSDLCYTAACGLTAEFTHGILAADADDGGGGGADAPGGTRLIVSLDTTVPPSSFIVPEPLSTAVDAWFEGCAEALVSSDWIVTEYASALAIKERAGRLSTADARLAWREFEAFCTAGCGCLPVSREAYREAAALVRHAGHGLRAGDALHLTTARAAGTSDLATLDVNQTGNARRLKLKTEGFEPLTQWFIAETDKGCCRLSKTAQIWRQ